MLYCTVVPAVPVLVSPGLTNPTDGLGAVGGYAALRNYTALGGQLTVFALSGN